MFPHAMFSRVKHAAFVLGFLTMLLPTPAAAAANGADAEETVEEPPAPVGVSLGSYYFREVRGTEGTKTRLSFSLYASVEQEHEAAFREILKAHEGRIRDQVITSLRLTETRDLNEPDLTRVRRRMLLRLRRTLPQLKIENLHFREFTLMAD